MRTATIRLAAAGDVARVGEIVRRAYSHYVERLGRPPAPMEADYGGLAREGVLWVLEADDEILAALVLRSRTDHLLVGKVAVDPRHQGRGLGRRLLEHADAMARSRGLPELRLHTHELMHENLELYSRLGWSEYDRRVQDGFPRVFMRKSVTMP